MKILFQPWFSAVVLILVQPVATAFLFMNGAMSVISSVPAREDVRTRETQRPWDVWTPEMERVAEELRKRTADAQEREAALTRVEMRLANERAELDQLRKGLEGQRAEVSKLFTDIAQDELKNLKTLATTYSNLSPKAAVTILDQMDDTFAVKILYVMKADAVSAIFEEMARAAGGADSAPAKRAATLSEQLRRMRSRPTP